MKKEIIQWPTEKGDNTMAISFFIWPLYYLLFLLAIVLSPFCFGHCIISFFFWPLYYLLFLLAIVLSPFSFGHCIISFFIWPLHDLLYKKEIIQWPNEKGDNTMAK
jgi:hypothetical protein